MKWKKHKYKSKANGEYIYDYLTRDASTKDLAAMTAYSAKEAIKSGVTSRLARAEAEKNTSRSLPERLQLKFLSKKHEARSKQYKKATGYYAKRTIQSIPQNITHRGSNTVTRYKNKSSSSKSKKRGFEAVRRLLFED